MHHALSIPELLAAIFEQINDQDMADDTLSALAQTCRAFHPTALDFLWASVCNVKWFLRLLPSDARTNHSAEELRNLRSTIKRDLTAAEWDNFHKYTSRVQELDLHQVQPGDNELFIATLRLCPFRPAFPKLRSLIMNFTASRFLPSISTFLCPSLESLKLAIEVTRDYSNSELSDLRALGAKCPKLRTLYIHFNHQSWTTFMSEMVCGCHYVNKFYCGRPLSNAALHHVARLPNLEELRIGTHSLWSLPLSESATAPSSSTRKSTSESSTTSDNGEFLLSIRSTPTILNLWSTAMPSTTDINKTLEWLSTLDGPSSLVDFEWQAIDYRPFQNRPEPSVFESLFRFHSLRRLTIDGICALPFNNNFLQALAEAYPQLEALSLNWKTGWREPQITIHGLARLFKGCRNLGELQIAINARVIDPLPEALTGPSVQNTHIETLHLVDSPVRHPISVTGLLREILPRLSCVQDRSSGLSMDLNYLNTHSIVWHEVNKQCRANVPAEVSRILEELTKH
ncbi:hypothetical protein BS17DRAFT_780414 [Gyrodon lividus]|nr:hypothetical protein BS17DRAFT_780414 [Gyrodon lividus]